MALYKKHLDKIVQNTLDHNPQFEVVYVFDDGNVFGSLAAAKNHKTDLLRQRLAGNKINTDWTEVTRSAKDPKPAKAPATPKAPKQEVPLPANTEEALKVLKEIDPEKAEWPLMKSIVSLLQLKVENKKKATLVAAIVKAKSELNHTEKE